MSDTSLEELEKVLSYQFQDKEQLRLALTHPSVAHELCRPIKHNQRLEFLGDTVLGVVISRELYEKFPDASEGPLTKARAQMIKRHTLAEQARQIELGKYLILSRGEEANSGRTRSSAMADAFEALIGAIFIDGGFDVARQFILRSFHTVFGELTSLPIIENPKGELQEMLQSQTSRPPVYKIISDTGRGHEHLFECVVTHDGVEIGRGAGKNKKTAESQAALNALNRLKTES